MLGASLLVAPAGRADVPVITGGTATNLSSDVRGYVSEYHFSNVPSMDGLNSPNNARFNISIRSINGSPNSLIGIGWDVTIQTIAPQSWLSDMLILFSHTGGGFNGPYSIRPGSGNNFPGGPTRFTSSGVVSFPTLSMSNDAILQLQFFEDFNDALGQDGLWIDCTLYLVTGFEVPSPSAAPLLSTTAIFGSRRRPRVRARCMGA